MSQSGSGKRAQSLGVRRPEALPGADIEQAEELTPAADAESAREADRPASAGEVRAGEAQEQPAPAAKEENDEAPAADTAAVVGPATGVVQDDGMPLDRPKKPVLAAVAIGGAVLLAVPILLIGTGSHHTKRHRIDAAADRVLSGNGQPLPGAYNSASPSATPTPTVSASAKQNPSVTKTAMPSVTKTAMPSVTKTAMPSVTKTALPPTSAKNSSSSHAGRGSGVPASEMPVSGGNPWALEVHAPYKLDPGKTLRTNRIALTMQTSGDLVLRDTTGKIIWSTRTHNPGAWANFQTDGNFVIYGIMKVFWTSGTQGHNGATLVLQADDNMVIYDGHNAIWATGTTATAKS